MSIVHIPILKFENEGLKIICVHVFNPTAPQKVLWKSLSYEIGGGEGLHDYITKSPKSTH